VLVIGSGWRFTSGISHYTYRLAAALADQCQVSALLMRGLVPKRLYPGKQRVGADVTDAVYHTLEAHLQTMSELTGGTYQKTHIFPVS